MHAFRSFLNVMADSPTTLPPADSFLYFGFGSNLSSCRVRKNNPSAEFVTIAKLSGYSLKFCGHSYNWKGATATISAEEGGEVWGVVWRIAQRHSEALDRQEGPRYRKLCVDVTAPTGVTLTCTTYELRAQANTCGPSLQYINTVLSGAKEHKLPEEYLAKLMQVEHNGYEGEVVIP